MSSEMRLSAWVGKLGSVLPRGQKKDGQRLLSAFGHVDTIAILAKVDVYVSVCVCVCGLAMGSGNSADKVSTGNCLDFWL